MTSATNDLSQARRIKALDTWPYWLAFLILAAATAAGFAVGGGSNAAVSSVLDVSSRSSNFLGTYGTALPFGFAFAAGMVATVNPCGFVMLPAYLGLYVGAQDDGPRPDLSNRLIKGTTVSIAVGAGFIVIFGTVGIIISAGAQSIAGVFPWIGIGVGVLLTITSGYILAGGKLYTAFATQTASKIGDPRDASMRGYFLFGISYATASLSCTLPIFLAIVSSSLATGGFVPAAGQFIFYALGMAFVIAIVTLSIAIVQNQVTGALRKILPHTNTISSILLLIAGGYLVFYWLTEGGLSEKIL